MEGCYRQVADPNFDSNRGRGRVRPTQSVAISRNARGRIARGYWADLRYKHVGQQHTGHHHDASRSLCRGGDHNSRELRPSFWVLWFAAANPNQILARILADLHGSDGRVTIPGFYDGVPELSEALRQQWAMLNFDSEAFLGAVSLRIPAGERGRSVLEMICSRPTCEINAMGGGYQDQGFKTVIPSQASAKVSFRLVFDQDPHAIRAAFREFVKARIPADCRAAFKEHGGGSAIQFPTEHPAPQKSRDALTREWGRDAVFSRHSRARAAESFAARSTRQRRRRCRRRSPECGRYRQQPVHPRPAEQTQCCC